VLDVPPKLAARVRLLQAGDTSKNHPNDAFSVAVAALRSKARRPVIADGHAAVLKVWAKKHRDLGPSRNHAACRLHAVPRPGARRCPQGDQRRPGRPHPRAGQAIGSGCRGALRAGRRVLNDICRLDAQLREATKKLAAAVRASGASLTGIFGVGPVIAGTVRQTC
jgi:transposase